MQLTIEPRTARSARHLHTIERCFQYSFLTRRDSRDGTEQAELEELRPLFEGDLGFGRRRHRRHGTYLPALLSTAKERHHGILLNVSAGGLLVGTPRRVAPGSSIEVLVGRRACLQHLFTCRVLRCVPGRRWFALGCQFTAPLLELRA